MHPGYRKIINGEDWIKENEYMKIEPPHNILFDGKGMFGVRCENYFGKLETSDISYELSANASRTDYGDSSIGANGRMENVLYVEGLPQDEYVQFYPTSEKLEYGKLFKFSFAMKANTFNNISALIVDDSPIGYLRREEENFINDQTSTQGIHPMEDVLGENASVLNNFAGEWLRFEIFLNPMEPDEFSALHSRVFDNTGALVARTESIVYYDWGNESVFPKNSKISLRLLNKTGADLNLFISDVDVDCLDEARHEEIDEGKHKNARHTLISSDGADKSSFDIYLDFYNDEWHWVYKSLEETVEFLNSPINLFKKNDKWNYDCSFSLEKAFIPKTFPYSTQYSASHDSGYIGELDGSQQFSQQTRHFFQHSMMLGTGNMYLGNVRQVMILIRKTIIQIMILADSKAV